MRAQYSSTKHLYIFKTVAGNVAITIRFSKSFVESCRKHSANFKHHIASVLVPLNTTVLIYAGANTGIL